MISKIDRGGFDTRVMGPSMDNCKVTSMVFYGLLPSISFALFLFPLLHICIKVMSTALG
jgi:hypothetical protein